LPHFSVKSEPEKELAGCTIKPMTIKKQWDGVRGTTVFHTGLAGIHLVS